MKNTVIRMWHILYAWVCPICQTTNERGNVCTHCGSPKPDTGGGGGHGGGHGYLG